MIHAQCAFNVYSHIHNFFSLLGSITEAKQNEGMLDASLSFVCFSFVIHLICYYYNNKFEKQ